MGAVFFYLIFLLTSLILTKLFFFKKKSANSLLLPPSPPSLPLIGHLHLIKIPLNRSLALLSSRYGPLLLLRFGSRRVLLVSSHSLAVDCFTKNDLAFASRPQLPSTKLISYNYTTLAAAPYGPHWRNIRRIATVELLSSARLNNLYRVRLDEARHLISNLFQDHQEDGGTHEFKKVELKSKLFRLTVNVMMRTIAGKRYYVEGEGKDSEEARRFREMVRDALTLVGASNVSDFVPALRWVGFRGLRKRIERTVRVREEVLQGMIDERRRINDDGGGDLGFGGENKTLIEVLLSLQKESPEYYTDDIIKAQIMTLLIAGSDTTTETMEWAMSQMVNNPEILHKARSEIDACVGKSRLVGEQDLSNLPYLQAIINETLRIHPTAPVLVPHESLEECTVGGYTIPRGTMLLVNAWAIQRDPEAWEEPTKFKPERFMDGNKKEYSKLIPFGMGRRKCPGEGLAIRVIGLVLSTLIQCFEWEKIGEEEVDMEEKGGGITLCKAIPLEVMYKPDPGMISVLSQMQG